LRAPRPGEAARLVTMARRVRRVAALACAVAVAVVAATAVFATPARAADDSNIPGTPLPSSPVTGQLGGPIYDHVYRVSVPAGSVLLASLTGDPGTDFDLYLFDSSATSVLENPPAGLVAKSVGPTSTESISYPSRAGGTLYLDLNGASDVQGAFRLDVSIVSDTVAPSVALRIQGGSASVSNPTVTLTIVAQDALSGVDAMAFSSDGTTWQGWQPYVPTMLWTFPAGDGTKQLWIRVRDRAGNVSAVAQASTVLDTAAPTVAGVSPSPDSVVGTVRPSVTVKFSKPMLPLWWNVGGVAVEPVSGGPIVPGTFTYDDASRTGTFVPSVDLVAGSPYQVQVATLYDIAGNRLAPYSVWHFTPKQQVPLTLALMPTSIVSGSSSFLQGTAQLATPSAVEVQERTAGALDWTTIAAPFPDASGTVRQIVSPTTNASYRLHVAGGGSTAESWSAVASLPVHHQVSIVGLTPGTGVSAKAGTARPLQARVGPAMRGVVVSFRVYRWDAIARAWKPYVIARRTTDAQGVARWSWTQRTGKWYLRATTDFTALNAAGASSIYKWNVK